MLSFNIIDNSYMNGDKFYFDAFVSVSEEFTDQCAHVCFQKALIGFNLRTIVQDARTLEHLSITDQQKEKATKMLTEYLCDCFDLEDGDPFDSNLFEVKGYKQIDLNHLSRCVELYDSIQKTIDLSFRDIDIDIDKLSKASNHLHEYINSRVYAYNQTVNDQDQLFNMVNFDKLLEQLRCKMKKK